MSDKENKDGEEFPRQTSSQHKALEQGSPSPAQGSEYLDLTARLGLLEDRVGVLEGQTRCKSSQDCQGDRVEVETKLWMTSIKIDDLPGLHGTVDWLIPTGCLHVHGFKPGDLVKITRIKAGETQPPGAGAGK